VQLDNASVQVPIPSVLQRADTIQRASTKLEHTISRVKLGHYQTQSSVKMLTLGLKVSINLTSARAVIPILSQFNPVHGI